MPSLLYPTMALRCLCEQIPFCVNVPCQVNWKKCHNSVWHVHGLVCLGRVGQITESLFKPCQKVLGNLDFSCIVNFHLPHTCNVAFSVRKRGLKCKVHGETFFKFYFDLKAIWCFFSFCSRGNCQFDRPCQVERSECFAKLNGKQYYCIGGERQLALKRKQYTVLNS